MRWGKKEVISVGGGKGGVGKSCFSANLGTQLSRMGKRVVLVDADIGSANLHTITGVRYPERTLDDFIKGRISRIEDTLINTPYPRLQLLSSASDVLSITEPNFAERQRLFKAIRGLDTDIIVFDIAAGTNMRTMDFFSLAPIMVIVIEPVPTSLENSFLFLKNLLLRHLMRLFYHNPQTRKIIAEMISPQGGRPTMMPFNELLDKLEAIAPKKIQDYKKNFVGKLTQVYLVANRLRSPQQKEVFVRFVKIVKRYLALNLKILGNLPFELNMDSAIIARTPFVIQYPQSGYSQEMYNVINNLPLS